MTDAWTATAEKAAERARTLRPIAITLFAIGMAMIANDVVPVSRECFGVLVDGQRQFSALCVLQEVGPRLILAGPAIALVWALWEAQSYLKRVEDGAVWAPAISVEPSRAKKTRVFSVAMIGTTGRREATQ